MGVEAGKDLLGEEPQVGLGDLVGHAAIAEDPDDAGTLEHALVLDHLLGHLRGGTEDLEVGEEPRELLDLMEATGGHSGGRRILREEAYEGRVG